MFGFKNIKITTKNKYTLDELFAAIKDAKFSAGQPQIATQINLKFIVFPAQDNNNQIRIMSYYHFNKPANKFIVSKDIEVGNDAFVKNVAINNLTNGLSAFTRMFGRNAKECKRLLDVTVKELNDMNL